MVSATVTSKGQITIPAAVRRQLGLRTGSRLNFVQHDDGRVEIRPDTSSIKDLKGRIAWRGDPISLAEMDAAIAAGAAAASDRRPA